MTSFPTRFQNRFLKTSLVSNFLPIGGENGNERCKCLRIKQSRGNDRRRFTLARFHRFSARFLTVSKTVSIIFHPKNHLPRRRHRGAFNPAALRKKTP